MDAVDEVSTALVLLVRGLKGLHRTVLDELGVRLELPALALLTLLEDGGPQRPSALAEALQVDLSSVSRQVSGLEREGWLVRERDPDDSRAQLLRPTPSGTAVVARVRAARSALLRERLPGWSEQELSGFAADLVRFSVDLGAPLLPPTRRTSPSPAPLAPQETPA